MSKHTPGPWKTHLVDGAVVIDTGGHEVAEASGDYETAAEEMEANARMIAAAPDMYEALKETWRIIDAAGLLNLSSGVQLGQTSWYIKASDAKERADAAIAKAEGRV